MTADNILRTYGDLSAREDVVLNAIEILTAKETQIFNMLGKSTAINTIHAYLTDTLRTAASQAVEEAADYTALANSTPSRITNIVEIIAVPFKVSRTQQNISHYQGEDELQRQTTKALMDWGNSAEFDLVRSTLASGVSGTAPALSKHDKAKQVFKMWCRSSKQKSRTLLALLLGNTSASKICFQIWSTLKRRAPSLEGWRMDLLETTVFSS